MSETMGMFELKYRFLVFQNILYISKQVISTWPSASIHFRIGLGLELRFSVRVRCLNTKQSRRIFAHFDIQTSVITVVWVECVHWSRVFAA